MARTRWRNFAVGRVRVAAIDTPIQLGGIAAERGDYIVADLTGVVVILADRIAEVLTVAEKLERQDGRFWRALGAGREFGEIVATLRHLWQIAARRITARR